MSARSFNVALMVVLALALLAGCAPTSQPAPIITPTVATSSPMPVPSTTPTVRATTLPSFTPTIVSTPAVIKPTATFIPANLTLPAGYKAEISVTELRGPTQMIIGPGGVLWVAQLNGDENAGQGQVVAVDWQSSGRPRVLISGLMKPTGIALTRNALWIAAGRNILRAPLTSTGEVGKPETILKDLPFNTRSEGTLTVASNGHLIYETSGEREGNSVQAGGAMLWELDPANPTQPRAIARGLKNAYGHTFDGAGRLWVTDVTDDPVNGQDSPDELNLVVEGADFGYPRCFGKQQAALNYGGSEASCRVTRAAVATFPAHSTPTSVVASPWEKDVLLVALWGPTQPAVMRVPFVMSGDNAVAQKVEPFITGFEHPIHLLVLSDNSLLVSDHGTGAIYRITRG